MRALQRTSTATTEEHKTNEERNKGMKKEGEREREREKEPKCGLWRNRANEVVFILVRNTVIAFYLFV